MGKVVNVSWFDLVKRVDEPKVQISPFSLKVVVDCLVALPTTIKFSETLKWFTLLPILMQNHFGGDCRVFGVISHPPPSTPPQPNHTWTFGPHQYLSRGNLALV